ncbi:hypothetical protein [Clostridium tetani]|uniref:hypothetical protein n=1 Tax=Clostridium tetani TaxID=1513 RepID=UPI00051333C2|nr:hypothetical protein [Clostridium tetani]KGI43018.1 hypothetical protein KY55_08260 [Clostridium tetani]RXI44044.1 hypothetical protein DP126_12635 [Clostridium tetani]RXI67451.1 hypothetical protein DP127_14235 [Clostridium tetani]RXM59597.1 hypothetical protein DP138_12910 [Clostridium tetani]RXM63660.1 hypothetical protein DP145_13580 [Clostridium tetani]
MKRGVITRSIFLIIIVLLLAFIFKYKDQNINILVNINNKTKHEINDLNVFLKFKNIDDRKNIIEKTKLLPGDNTKGEVIIKKDKLFSIYIKSNYEVKSIYYVAASNPKNINVNLHITDYNKGSNELEINWEIETDENKDIIQAEEKLRLK